MSIEDDLIQKLSIDIRKACLHHHEMCEVADIPQRNQWANMMLALSQTLIDLAKSGKMKKETLIELINKLWSERRHSNALHS